MANAPLITWESHYICTRTHNNPPYCIRVLSDITQKSDGLQLSAEAHIFSFPSDAIRKLLKRTPVYSQVLPCEKWRKKTEISKASMMLGQTPWTFPPHQQRMRMQNAILFKNKSRISKTTHFRNFLENTPLPDGVVLATLDVCLLYSSIPNEEGIEVVCQYYQGHYQSKAQSLHNHLVTDS